MRLSIPLVFLLAGCGASLDAPGADLGSAGDLAQPPPVNDLSSPPTIVDLAQTIDLFQAADLLPSPACDGGNCHPSGCDSGQVLAAGQCQLIQTPDQCAALHREYVPDQLIGYCADCVAPYQAAYGHCAMPMCGSADGTLGALCAELERGCDESGPGGSAECAACQAGATLDVSSQACVKTSCATRADCPEIAGYFCTQLATSDAPQCRKRPCPSGETWDRTSAGTSMTSQSCTACASCAGNEWPVTDYQGNCYCNASPGWFYDHSTASRALEQCDEDGDGWLKESVKEELTHATSNPARLDYTVLFNIQCTVPYFTRVELHNEWQQSLPLSLGAIGQAAGVTGVAMYEDPANDSASTAAIVDGTTLSGYSVNSLTKACSSSTLDLNRNGVGDIIEDQTKTQPGLLPWAADYQPLTLFSELYQARFSPSPIPSPIPLQLCDSCPTLPVSAQPGALVIQERSRCEGNFPMPLSSSTDPSTNNYWENCERRRPEAYSGEAPLTFDFASYDCGSDNEGACSYSWPSVWSTSGTHEAPPPAVAGPSSDGTVPAHGLCNGGVAQIPWMGMTAYSQFMCASVHDGTKQYASDVAVADVYSSTNNSGASVPFEALTCHAEDATPGVPGATATFACNVSPNGAASSVTWLARRYLSYTDDRAYNGGCIDEGTDLSVLCPNNPIGAANDYGLILCGPPCPDVELSTGNNGTVQFAVCLHPTLTALPSGTIFASSNLPSPSPSWQLIGEVPLGTIGGTAKSCSDTVCPWQVQ